MTKIYGIILLLITMLQTTTNNKIHQLSQLSTYNYQDLSDNESILVELQSNHNYPQANIAIHYYLIRIIHKEKKEAYHRLKDMLHKVTNILISSKAIPNEELLVKSKISSNYLSKKRSWSFSTIFLVLGTEKELDKYHRQLRGLKIQRLNTVPSVSFPYHKIQALRSINKAKQRLLAQLRKFPNLQIKEILLLKKSKKHKQSENQNNSSPSLSDEQVSTIQTQQQKPQIQNKLMFRIGLSISNDECEQQSQGHYQQEQFSDQQSQYSYESI